HQGNGNNKHGDNCHKQKLEILAKMLLKGLPNIRRIEISRSLLLQQQKILNIQSKKAHADHQQDQQSDQKQYNQFGRLLDIGSRFQINTCCPVIDQHQHQAQWNNG